MSERHLLNELLRRHGLRTSKALGQHFLADEEILRTIAKASNPGPDSQVVEVGSGPSNLTVLLGLSGARVTGIEMDLKFKPLHHEIVMSRTEFADKVKFHYGDALDFDYKGFGEQVKAEGLRYLIIGNIPYQITSPLIMGILESGAPFDEMILMMQREVALRLNAEPGGKTNGAITIKVQYYADVELICDVPSSCFVPPPKVESQVLRFTRREQSDIVMDAKGKPRFFKLVDAGFMYRRKTLPNAFLGAGVPFSREEIVTALAQMDLPETVRAEQLGVLDYMTLDAHLHKEF